MRRAAVALVALAAVTGGALRAASAGPRAIVVESHVGKRPEGAGDLLAPAIAALAEHGAVGGAALSKEIETVHSAPAALVTAEHLTTAQRLVEQAEKLIAQKRDAEAVRILPSAVDVYRAQAAAVAGDPSLRDLAYRALVALATAHAEVGNTEQAHDTVAQLLRAFPDRPPGGPLADLTKQVTSELAATATLKVDSDQASADLFVDERKVGTGHAEVTLPPGSYRVLARNGDTAGRVHTVTVRAGATATVHIDWALESSLITDGDFVGFVFPTDAERTERGSDLARRLARALGAREVVVLGVRDDAGARHVNAAALSADSGKLLLAASVPAEPIAELSQRAAALADYLAGQPARDGVEPVGEVKGAGKATVDVAKDPGERARTRRYYLGGAITGVAMIATGAVLVWLDGNGNCSKDPGQVQCPNVYDTGLAGWITAGTGTALAAVSTYLWYRAHPSRDSRALGLAPTGGGLTVTLSGRF